MNVRLSPANASLIRFALVALLAIAAQPVLAAVPTTGGVDPSAGLTNATPWIQGMAELVIILAALWRGTHAVMEGRSLGPSVVGALGGTLLAFAGPYIMKNIGLS